MAAVSQAIYKFIIIIIIIIILFIIIVYYSSRSVIFFRPVENIRGFSGETVIEVTTNIESQERRRLLNKELGCVEHPRAAVTDDLETFYSITHRDLGNVFILKQFKEYWPKGVR